MSRVSRGLLKLFSNKSKLRALEEHDTPAAKDAIKNLQQRTKGQRSVSSRSKWKATSGYKPTTFGSLFCPDQSGELVTLIVNNDGIEQEANGLEAVDDMQSVSPGTTLNGKYAQVSFGKFCYVGLISDDGDNDNDNECEIHCMR